MKNSHIPFFALFILFFSCNAQEGPSVEWQIKMATMAAPEEMREGAKVLGFDGDGKVITLREGTNEMTCIADDPTKDGFSVAAYQKDLEPFMMKGRELQASGKTRQEIFDARAAAIEAGEFKISQGSILYILTGTYDMEADTLNDQYLRYVVYIPFATTESTGLPLKSSAPGSPWIMDPGTHRAHIMINPPSN